MMVGDHSWHTKAYAYPPYQGAHLLVHTSVAFAPGGGVGEGDAGYSEHFWVGVCHWDSENLYPKPVQVQLHFCNPILD